VDEVTPLDRYREERVTRNELAYRDANESLRAAFDEHRPRGARTLPFLCECGDRSCTAVVAVEPETYARVRSDPAQFLIAPGHRLLESEEVVAEGTNYQMIRKHGAAGELARADASSGEPG
jgi:hypothetical protein